MFCTRLANGGLFPTGDPIVPFVISPRFECLNKHTHTHTHTVYMEGRVWLCDPVGPSVINRPPSVQWKALGGTGTGTVWDTCICIWPSQLDFLAAIVWRMSLLGLCLKMALLCVTNKDGCSLVYCCCVMRHRVCCARLGVIFRLGYRKMYVGTL